jgi:predicted CXXCH cytochrome family protein
VPLKYFVGSNTRGRTFLFSIDRFLYQSPINYYARARAWDMSPGYADLTTMPLNHVVDQTCLFCHASQVATPESGTTNRFEGEAFGQDGVGCERCHGPGSDHAAGHGEMIDPAALAPEARDSICTQCHLEGQARIARAGRTLTGFRPGERLADSMAVFVFANAASAARGAVSHVESLAESVCKRKSGDRMSCLSCHNPHVQPEPAARAEYYRARCLQCHATLRNSITDQRDCGVSHAARGRADIGHTAVTDHRILRERAPPSPPTRRQAGAVWRASPTLATWAWRTQSRCGNGARTRRDGSSNSPRRVRSELLTDSRTEAGTGSAGPKRSIGSRLTSIRASPWPPRTSASSSLSAA